MRLIDTHSHLDDIQYADDITYVIERAKGVGIEKILLAGVNMKEYKKMVALSKEYEGYLFPMLGIHPEEASVDYKSQLTLFDKEISDGGYVAVGEIGMDLYWTKDTRDIQVEMFKHQLSVALELDLPVSIHSRDAYQATIDVIKYFGKDKLRGVWHCFTLSPEQAKEIFSIGDFYVGIGGVSTFKNAKFTERLTEIPLNRILLETDSPYLAPTPKRGERNEPSYIAYVAEKLAQIYNISAEEVGNITTKNAESLFF